MFLFPGKTISWKVIHFNFVCVQLIVFHYSLQLILKKKSPFGMVCRFKALEIQATDIFLFDSFVFITSPKNIPERAIINISDSREADM